MYNLWYQLLFDNVRHDLLELSHYNSYMWISLCGNRDHFRHRHHRLRAHARDLATTATTSISPSLLAAATQTAS